MIVTGQNLPKCCNREMNIKLDLGKLMEAHCDVCGDVVYIKKSEIQRPKMVDD